MAADPMANALKKNLIPVQTAPRRKTPQTHIFELKLGESNDQVYPEFSWSELVRKAEAEKKKAQGESLLNPFASDDEDDLKAMAAKFEEKYGTPTKSSKVDDFDRGAGYDDNDSFIDNTDAYDERVPRKLEPAHGGFYINSGRLDSKEVCLSDDNETESLLPTTQRTGHPKLKNVTSEHSIKKRRISREHRPGPGRPKGSKNKPKIFPPVLHNPSSPLQPETSKTIRRIESSSSSSSSSNSSSSSSSSDDSSSSSDNEAKNNLPISAPNLDSNVPNEKKIKSSVEVKKINTSSDKLKTNFKKENLKKLKPDHYNVTIKRTTLPGKMKTKNLTISPSTHTKITPSPVPNKTIPPATITPKIISQKDIVGSTNGGTANSSSVIKVPTPNPKHSMPPSSQQIPKLATSSKHKPKTSLLANSTPSTPPGPLNLKSSKSPSATAQELINQISKLSKSKPVIQKSLPKLKHKSGIVIEKSSPGHNNSASKVKPHGSPNFSTSQLLSSMPSIQKSLSQLSSYFQAPSSTVEITQLKNHKPLPAISPAITVTEVKEKSPVGTPNQNFSSKHSSKGSPSNYTSIFSAAAPSASLGVGCPGISTNNTVPAIVTTKLSHSISISPATSLSAANPISSDRNKVTPVNSNKGNAKPTYITPFDVNAILMNNSKSKSFDNSKSHESGTTANIIFSPANPNPYNKDINQK